MSQKRRRYTVVARGRMLIIFLFFGVIMVTLGYTFFHDLGRIYDMKLEKESLVVESDKLVEEIEAVEADIKRLSDPEYIARYAREKYFYSKEGEIILRIEE